MKAHDTNFFRRSLRFAHDLILNNVNRRRRTGFLSCTNGCWIDANFDVLRGYNLHSVI